MRKTKPATAANGDEPSRLEKAPCPARAAALDDDMLMMFEEGLRAHLPGVQEIIERAALRKRRARGAVAAAVLAALAAVCWLNPAYRSEQLATAVGKRGTWTLGDGSEVTLNTGSELRVDYHLRSRQLYLTKGEALFRVAHSGWRSFFVYANRTTVQDIGTVFDVQNTVEGARVIVLEGRVLVTAMADPGRPRPLEANQSAEVGAGSLSGARRVDAGLSTLWRQGKLHFDNTPLADVTRELQRYRSGPIRLAPDLVDLRITGQFDIDRIDQLLAMLPTLAPVAVRRDDDGGIRIEGRNAKARSTAAAP